MEVRWFKGSSVCAETTTEENRRYERRRKIYLRYVVDDFGCTHQKLHGTHTTHDDQMFNIRGMENAMV